MSTMVNPESITPDQRTQLMQLMEDTLNVVTLAPIDTPRTTVMLDYIWKSYQPQLNNLLR